MLARTIDKARAALAGTLGEYYYDCPMDQQLFATLGVDGEEFKRAVDGAPDDATVIAWLREKGSLKSPDAFAAHNRAIDAWEPKSDAGRARFEEQRNAIAPGRSDVRNWTDLIEFEEGRIPAGRN